MKLVIILTNTSFLDTITLYDGPNFTGYNVTIDCNKPALGFFDNSASSARVRGKILAKKKSVVNLF